ncbi:MAG: polysaccharide lyase family 7 protein [Bacteroidota bacterium]
MEKALKVQTTNWISAFVLSFLLFSCSFSHRNKKVPQQATNKGVPSDVIPSLMEWNITLGNGATIHNLTGYSHQDFFYMEHDGEDWVVFKTPNSGSTTPNSSNTRTELRHKADWTVETGGHMSASVRVQHVSISGDPRVAASFSVVVGQIHSGEGHKNEPLKIFYKNFPNHNKGSLFWNYEINTDGNNSGRWDFSTPVWGHDMSVVSHSIDEIPEEPIDGIALGEEFSYKINVVKGEMHLTFSREGHLDQTFVKDLTRSDFSTTEERPEQVKRLYANLNRNGLERPEAYSGELQFFKLGAYNQTNGKNPLDNMVWSTGAATFAGDIDKQYQNGSYTEVWFKEVSVSITEKP